MPHKYLGSCAIWVFLHMLWWHVLISLIYIKLSNFPNTICWRDCLCPLYIPAYLVLDETEDRCVWVYFLLSFCFIDEVSVSVNTIMFWDPVIFSICEFWKGYASSFFLFSQNCWQSRSLWLQWNLGIICSVWWKVSGVLERDCIKS